jgi:hypothetical protein
VTWRVTLTEGYGGTEFENRVRRIFRISGRDELTGGWSQFYNKELHKCEENCITRSFMICTHHQV